MTILFQTLIVPLYTLKIQTGLENTLWPLIVLDQKDMFTLPVGLAIMKGYSIWKVPWGEVMAASFVASVPVLVLFLLMQRHFIGGLQFGSVKG